jgi:chromosome segregation ATPase
MNQEKFVNAYVELLNATLTEALQKNLVLQVQKTLADQEFVSYEEKIRDIETRYKELISQRDQEIGNLKGQLNEERRQTAIVSNEREEIRKSNQHVDTFKSELLKARAEINSLKESIVLKDSDILEKLSRITHLESKNLKKIPSEKTKSTAKETTKDAGNF